MYYEENDYLDELRFYKKFSLKKEKNLKIIKKYLGTRQGNLDYYLSKVICLKSEELQEEPKKLLIIECLLECGADCNYNKYRENRYSVLHEALSREYSESFILNLIELLYKYNFNFNITNKYNVSIMEYLFTNTGVRKNITKIYKSLVDKGFDIFHTDYEFCTIEERMKIFSGLYDDYNEFIKLHKKDKEEKYETRKNEIINEIITKHPNFDYVDYDRKNLLFILLYAKYDEDMIIEIIKELKDKGMVIDLKDSWYDTTVIETIIEQKHSNRFLNKFVNIALENEKDLNKINSTCIIILDSLIRCSYKGKIMPIYNNMVKYGFDQNIIKKYIIISKDKTIYQLFLDNEVKFSDKSDFITNYMNYINNSKNLNDEIFDYFNNVGIFINDKNYDNKYNFKNVDSRQGTQAIGVFSREGGGKSKFLQELAKYNCAKYDELVFLTSSENIIKNSKNISEVRLVLLKLMQKCVDYNIILLIDDIDKLYNLKGDKYLKTEIDIILYHYIKNTDLRLIYTINESIRDDILNPLLCECTDLFDLEKHNNFYLIDIIGDILFDLRNNNKITNDNKMLNIVKELLFNIISKDSNLINTENISKLKIGNDIIKNMYQSCLNNNRNYIEINDLIYGLKTNLNIKDDIKNIIINELLNLNNNLDNKNINILMKKIK